MSEHMNVHIIPMTADHLDEIAALERVCFPDPWSRQMLAEAIECLKEKEKMVISLYYVEELNMGQIAQILEVSEPRISQIHSSAIRKLKAYMGSYM